jgi:hypothetical protein
MAIKQFALAVRLCILIIDPKQCTDIPQIAASFSVNLTRSGIPGNPEQWP